MESISSHNISFSKIKQMLLVGDKMFGLDSDDKIRIYDFSLKEWLLAEPQEPQESQEAKPE